MSEHLDLNKGGLLVTDMHVILPFKVPAQLSAEEVVQHARQLLRRRQLGCQPGRLRVWALPKQSSRHSIVQHLVSRICKLAARWHLHTSKGSVLLLHAIRTIYVKV